MLRIGLTADWQKDPRGHLRLAVNRDYFEWLRSAGFAAVAVPAIPGSEAEALGGVDGLVLSGGGDILPGFYGADPEPLPTERYSHPDRCAFEFALVWRCVKSRFPLLGICLGCQTINAAMGGDLIRHLDDPLGRHRRPDPDRPGTRHRIHAEPQSVIGKLYPSPQTRVHSSHHQAVGRLAPGFTVTARGPDGVVEAIENPAYPWILGVQWHPERTPHSPFSALLARWLREQAEQYARGKRG